VIAAAMPRQSAASSLAPSIGSPLGSPLASSIESLIESSLVSLFAAFGARFGGDAEPLAEDAIVLLVEQARAGDTGARQTLYVQHVDRVFRVVRGILRSDADAEDATQDAMLKVLTSLHRYKPRADARFAAWVMTIAVNTARRRFRRRRPELTATGELPETPDDGADPADGLERAQRRRALLTALAELSERERLIVSLRYGAELNASEIAATVGIESAAIRKILERARTRLGSRIDALLNPEGRSPEGGM
jgi:RNA polymerase sigma-70 factor (ECF subfamily)